MRNAIGAVILAALYGTSFAQTRPDFSGKWTQVSERHTYQISSVTPPPSIMIVSQDGSTLKVAASEPGAVARVYKLDGSESRNVWHVNAQQIDRISTAKWAGEHIVISTPVFHKITIPWNPPAPFGSYTEHQVWSLRDGNLVITSTPVSPVDPIRAVGDDIGTWIYAK